MTFHRHMFASAACALAFAAPAFAIGEPYGVVATSYPSAQQATVSWASDATGVQAFKVERRILGSRAWVQAAYLADPAARSFVDGPLRNETSFEYRVTAYLDVAPATGLPSIGWARLTTPSQTATQADYDAAATPRNLDAQPLAARAILLSWTDASPDETGFKVERRPAGATVWQALALTAPNVQTWRDNTVNPATAYEYRVTAERPGLVSLPTAPRLATTPSAATAFTIKFVDAVNGLDTNAGTEAAPYQTIQRAADVVPAGGTVLVRGGLYRRSNGFAVVAISRSGLPTAYTTYRAFPGERPKIRTTKGQHYAGIDVRVAAYIVLDGFEVEGHLNDISIAEADADYLAYKNQGIAPGPVTSNSGVSIEGRAGSQSTTHHVVVRNMLIHDHPLGGISANGTDYVTVENNRVRNVGRYSTLGGSGISFLGSKAFDGETVVPKQIIRGNVVSEAINDYPCACYGFQQPTDGNGIIVDTQASYAGKTLITNNIVFDNGGRGIHILKSGNVDVVFNTTYRNSTKLITGDGEITSQNATKVRVYNNIMVARPDRPLNLLTFTQPADAATVDFNHNLLLGGNRYTASTGLTGGQNNRVGLDPRFLGVAGANAFQLDANSPALDSAWAGFPAPATDAYQAPRPRGGGADVGAVESF